MFTIQHHHHLVFISAQTVQGAIQLLHTPFLQLFEIRIDVASATAGSFARLGGPRGLHSNSPPTLQHWEPPSPFLLTSPIPPTPMDFFNQESIRESKEVRKFFNLAELQSYIFCYEYYCSTENPLCPLVCASVYAHSEELECWTSPVASGLRCWKVKPHCIRKPAPDTTWLSLPLPVLKRIVCEHTRLGFSVDDMQGILAWDEGRSKMSSISVIWIMMVLIPISL